MEVNTYASTTFAFFIRKIHYVILSMTISVPDCDTTKWAEIHNPRNMGYKMFSFYMDNTVYV